MPRYFPESLSYIGKINQFLSQIVYEQNNKLFRHQDVSNYLNFFTNLSDSLVSLFYLQKILDKTKYKNLLKFLTHPEEILPNIECKYLFSRFDLPKFKIYSNNELKLNLHSIKNLFELLNKDLKLISEMSEIDFQGINF